jgi:hypothetical protein
MKGATMPPVKSRAPVVDTSQEPRCPPVIIWVDTPAPETHADRRIRIACWILTVLTILYFAMQIGWRA